MASMMRHEGYAPSLDGVRSFYSSARQADGLAAFRLMVDAGSAQSPSERSLSVLIEREIIPRLMVAHGGGAALALPALDDQLVEFSEVEAFAPLAMQVDADVLLLHIETILARGVAFDTVMVDLLAPAARLLGEMWEDDLCDFIDVTMGLWRLQEVVHEIAARYPPDRAHMAGGHRALFASMPGDQHSFGTVVIDELFRRDGWLTERVCEAQTPDLLRRVADDWFDLVGLTISCDYHIATTPSIIAALRNVSRNPQICIMVGGSIFSASPELAAEVGADGTAPDAKLALKLAGELVRERASEIAA